MWDSREAAGWIQDLVEVFPSTSKAMSNRPGRFDTLLKINAAERFVLYELAQGVFSPELH